MGNDYFGSNRNRGISVKNDSFGDAYSKARHSSVNSGNRRNTGGPAGSGRSGYGGRKKGREKRGMPVVLTIIIDVLLTAALLGVFYITNYEMQGETGPIESLPVPSWLSSAGPKVTPADASVIPTGSNSAEQTAAADNWRTKFPDKFTDGTVVKTDNSYKDADINITIKEEEKDGVPYYTADIYIAELKHFRTAFAKNADKMGDRELTDKVADENNAILAINGDHCVDNNGPVVRNGKPFRLEKASLDALVMNYDGTMQTLSPDEVDIDKIKSEGAYQIWSFGPMLLKDGQPMTTFNSDVSGVNPRTAIGYFEPGHYCYVVIGGRQKGYDQGCTLAQLSQLFADMGCNAAYNLDGGRSSEMIFLGKMLNEQSDGRRSTTDILYIGD